MRRIPDVHDWRELISIDPMLPTIAEELLKRVPTANALVFYGSRIAGEADEYSDYDVLLIAPSEDLPGWQERAEMVQRLAERHDVEVQIAATTLDAAWLELRIAPYLHHWLAQGVICGDGTILREPLPPLAKEGARVSLGSIETDLEDVEEADSRRWKGEILMRALRRLLLLRASIENDYHYDVKHQAEKLVGATTVRRLRNSKGRVSQGDLEHLKAAVDELLDETRRLVAAMPENQSDQDLKQLWLYREKVA